MASLSAEFTNFQLPNDVQKDGLEKLNILIENGYSKLKQEEHDLVFLEKVQNDPMLLGRFLWSNFGNVEKAKQQVLDTSLWRRKEGIADMKRSDLEMHIVKEGVFSPSKFDVHGDRIIFLFISKHKMDKTKYEDNRKTYIYCKEKVVKMSPTHKITLVVDCSGAGLANADYKYIFLMLEVVTKYYPNTIGLALIHNMPWIFNVFWNIIKVFLPRQYRDKVKFVNNESIQQYIRKEHLPVSMGGDGTDDSDQDLLDTICGENITNK